MISPKIEVTKFSVKFQKLPFTFFRKFQMTQMFVKSPKNSQFWIIKGPLLQTLNSDSVGVKHWGPFNGESISYHPAHYFFKMFYSASMTHCRKTAKRATVKLFSKFWI